ncbi:MAG: hypothetical protein HZB80_08645 [Deltaproteobacteria bacterium]|nr:hypothetical protein [Deltaproteobacteria bacterium]
MPDQKIDKVIKMLLEAGMSHYNITQFLPNVGISEVSRAAVEIGLSPCKKGRPQENFTNLHKAEKERVAKMFIVGFDIITIVKVLKVDINSVYHFLTEDNTPFGVGRCVKCLVPFVYVGNDKRYCLDCAPKLNRKKQCKAVALEEDFRSLSL